MGAIDNIISVSITQDTSAVSAANFGVPLILGNSNPGWADGDNVHVYSDAASMLTDGFNSSSPEYVYATAMMSQTITPTEFLVGRKAGASSSGQSVLLTIKFGTSAYYGVIINSEGYYVSGVDQPTVAANLVAAINASNIGLSAAVTSANNVQVTIGANGTINTSQPDGITVGTPTTSEAVVPAMAMVLSTISAQNNDWYGLCLAGATDEDTQAAASYIEGVKKIFIGTTASADVCEAGTSDVATTLQAAGYRRSAIAYVPASKDEGFAAAWLGLVLPTTPGNATWAYKNLAGITADKLTSNQLAILYGNPEGGTAGKNANVYAPFFGTNVTYPGMMAGGAYIDITIGVDWLQANIQREIFSLLSGATKVPYTDAGGAMLASKVSAVLQTAVANGLIDGKDADYPVKVSVDSVDSVSKSQRAARIAPTIRFQGRLQGAFQSVRVAGTVTV